MRIDEFLYIFSSVVFSMVCIFIIRIPVLFGNQLYRCHLKQDCMRITDFWVMFINTDAFSGSVRVINRVLFFFTFELLNLKHFFSRLIRMLICMNFLFFVAQDMVRSWYFLVFFFISVWLSSCTFKYYTSCQSGCDCFDGSFRRVLITKFVLFENLWIMKKNVR